MEEVVINFAKGHCNFLKVNIGLATAGSVPYFICTTKNYVYRITKIIQQKKRYFFKFRKG